MARALIVGCGCRGKELAAELIAEGWAIRGTTRDPGRLEQIESGGAEAVIADPERPGTILDHVGDVAAVVWLLGSATGDAGSVAGIHGSLLERLLEKLVDSPVRGFAYEAAGGVEPALLEQGEKIVRRASRTWRIPVALLDESRSTPGWAARSRARVTALLD